MKYFYFVCVYVWCVYLFMYVWMDVCRLVDEFYKAKDVFTELGMVW